MDSAGRIRHTESWLMGYGPGPEPERHPGDAPTGAAVLGRPPMVLPPDRADGSVGLWLWGAAVTLLWVVIPLVAVVGYATR